MTIRSIQKTKNAPPKTVDLYVSPSKAYLATQCLQWQSIKSGNRILIPARNLKTGLDKHAAIEKDLSLVKTYLPVDYKKLEVYQELPVETKITHKSFRLEIKGIVDCLIFDKRNSKLFVYDWKTGGSQVDEISEEQLILYALCALEKFKAKELELIYVNPDSGESFTKNFTGEEIEAKVFEIILKIGAQTKKGFTVGSHCEYCPARSACPELAKQLRLLISPEINGKKIEHFSEMQLDLIKVGGKVIDELKDRLKAYLAFHHDKNLHGYILADRRGIRVIREDAELKIVAEKLGVKIDDLFEKRLFTIKKLEDRGLPVDSISDFTFQPISKVLKKI